MWWRFRPRREKEEEREKSCHHPGGPLLYYSSVNG